jgi:hypothetical protein
MLRVCAIANRIGGPEKEQLLALERSLARKGVPFIFQMESGPWLWKRKIEWELEWAKAYPRDLFVFIDAFDYLFLGELSELTEIVSAQPLLFSTDCGSVPFPDKNMVPYYDHRRKRESKWCWLNGSGPAGTGEAIAEAIEFGLPRFPIIPPSEQWPRGGTDQWWWTLVYLNGYGVLDQQCRMTQTLYDMDNDGFWGTRSLGYKDGRIHNLETGSKPQFIHANGHAWLMIPEELWR